MSDLSQQPNPFQAPTSGPPLFSVRREPPHSRMWRAYLIAPGFAPITFGVLLLIWRFLGGPLWGSVSPALTTALAEVALTVGFVVSYSFALVLWMPLAYLFRQLGCLSVRTVLLSALIACGLLAAAIAAEHLINSWRRFVLVGFAWFTGLAPSTLVSAFVYWTLIRPPRR